MLEVEIALLLRLLETGECKGSARAAALLERFRMAQWVSQHADQVTGKYAPARPLDYKRA
jgi:hypothetical protein